ncbi:MAG: NADH-dependent phenylglyoxylate, partial [Sedimentibacter sp.]
MTYIDTLREAKDLVTPGMSACQGCGGEMLLRRVLKIAGENTIAAIPPGCMAGAGGIGWDTTNGLKIPVHIPLLDNTASFLTGVSNIYQRNGREDVNLIAFAGDGA